MLIFRLPRFKIIETHWNNIYFKNFKLDTKLALIIFSQSLFHLFHITFANAFSKVFMLNFHLGPKLKRKFGIIAISYFYAYFFEFNKRFQKKIKNTLKILCEITWFYVIFEIIILPHFLKKISSIGK